MTTKVAHPTTLQEIIRLSPEQLQAFELDELMSIYEIAKTGKTKAASLKADMIAGMISARKKEAAKAKAAAKSEPVANSAKTAGKKANAAKASASKSAAKAPKAGKPTPPTPAPPKAASKGTTTKASKTTPKRTTKTPQDGFPDSITSENYVYRRFEPESIQHLGEVLVANPYAVYVFMDERVDDTLTQCLMSYASDKLVLFVDKSRQPETFLSVTTAAGVEQFIAGEYVQKDGKQSVSFPVAFYLREARG